MSAEKHKRKQRRGGAYAFSVETAGRMIGLSRASSFRAVARGQIPAIKVGRSLLVPKAVWLRQLGIETEPRPAPRQRRPAAPEITVEA